MEKCKRILATLTLTALAASVTFAEPRTFIGPTAHLGIVKTITDESAFALAGEVGPKNLRAIGTVGWEFDYHQRVKGTLEYLREKLTYSFPTGNQQEWMGQAAIGLDYQYDFRQIEPYNTLLDLSGYYSHSPSKNLGVTTLTSTISTTKTSSTVYNRIAGANAFGGGPGLTIATLGGTAAGLELDYDNVHYDTKNAPALTVKGLGGTFRLSQLLTENVKVSASAAVRKPFNDYAGNISFGNVDFHGIWSLSAFGDYMIGKKTLPSSYNVGLGADYFIDARKDDLPPLPQRPMPQNYKDYKDYKDMPPLVWVEPEVVDKDLLNWVAVPVHTPPLYTVPDNKIKILTICDLPAPVFSGPIPDQNVGYVPFILDVSPYFTGQNLTFTINPAPPFDGSGMSISGSTLTVDFNVYNTEQISITATNACGSVTSNVVTFNF